MNGSDILECPIAQIRGGGWSLFIVLRDEERRFSWRPLSSQAERAMVLLARRVISLCRKTCRLLAQQRTKVGPDAELISSD
jgi:hypothetical protein